MLGGSSTSAPASGAIEAHLLAIRRPKPAGFVMRIGEAVGAERRAPLGVASQIDHADIGDVHRVCTQCYRIQTVMDGERLRTSTCSWERRVNR